MFIVVGLGNPGREYARTRHNVGFDVIDVLSEKHHIQLTKNAMHGQIGEGFVGGEKLVLVKPQTFMNLSGQCVTELVSWYKPEMDHLLLIYDDIDLPLGRAEGSLLKRCPDPQGLPAHTHYEVLAAANGRALLRLTPTTGRTHQLRVHLAAIGHPLTGDWLYGTEDRALIARPALHSYHLVMRHPLTGSSIDVTAPLPEDMQALLR